MAPPVHRVKPQRHVDEAALVAQHADPRQLVPHKQPPRQPRRRRRRRRTSCAVGASGPRRQRRRHRRPLLHRQRRRWSLLAPADDETWLFGCGRSGGGGSGGDGGCRPGWLGLCRGGGDGGGGRSDGDGLQMLSREHEDLLHQTSGHEALAAARARRLSLQPPLAVSAAVGAGGSGGVGGGVVIIIDASCGR